MCWYSEHLLVFQTRGWGKECRAPPLKILWAIWLCLQYYFCLCALIYFFADSFFGCLTFRFSSLAVHLCLRWLINAAITLAWLFIQLHFFLNILCFLLFSLSCFAALATRRCFVSPHWFYDVFVRWTHWFSSLWRRSCSQCYLQSSAVYAVPDMDGRRWRHSEGKMLSDFVRVTPWVAGFSEIALETAICGPSIKPLAFRTLYFDPYNNMKFILSIGSRQFSYALHY